MKVMRFTLEDNGERRAHGVSHGYRIQHLDDGSWRLEVRRGREVVEEDFSVSLDEAREVARAFEMLGDEYDPVQFHHQSRLRRAIGMALALSPQVQSHWRNAA